LVVGLVDVNALIEGRNVVVGEAVLSVNGGEVGAVRAGKVAALLGGLV
jgi:hypothetical protein